ncbi:helix-turn-helix transcriptional regulator [Gordonia sp. NPDC003376]
MDNETLDGAAAARVLNTTPGTLATYRYLNKGPKYYKIGRRVVYRRSDLDAWLEAHAVNPGASA